MMKDFIISTLFAIAAPGVIGYFTASVVRRGELKALVSNSLRGFIVGAFICGCLGMAVIVREEFKHETDLVSIFKNIVIFSFFTAFSGGMGGALAVWRCQKRETKKSGCRVTGDGCREKTEKKD